MEHLCASLLGLCFSGQLIFSLSILFGYFILGRYISPDWDCITINSDEGRILREIPLLGILIVSYSTLYGSIFRRMHRSLWTHFPIVSTFIRWVFCFWWLYALLWRFHVPAEHVLIPSTGAFIGLSLADILHYLADKITKEIR